MPLRDVKSFQIFNSFSTEFLKWNLPVNSMGYSILVVLVVLAWFVALRPSQKLWSCRDGQFT